MSYEKNVIKINGEDKGKVFLFTLSTCIWCKKTKELLSALGVAYSYVDVDLVQDDSREEVIGDLHKYNPSSSFPTIVIGDGEKVILGFEEDQIRECFESGKRENQ